APPWTCAVPPPITVDGVPVQILFAGRSPGFGTFGLDQVNFVLPPGLLPGGHQLAYGPMTYMLQTQ
ncbi:MAG: hypothetical protein KGJ13_08150, partial [Patescibacteria group bacterium]|nr:hypothetical protein [Patescibacteria group bacterium]